MSESQGSPLPIGDSALYAHRALAKLAGAWTQKTPNLSGMRATFRRWRPDSDKEPTSGMRQYVWGWIGSPFKTPDQSPEAELTERTEKESEEDRKARKKRERIEEELIDQAATIVAMRAAAGDHEASNSIGTALHKAGMNDMRLMRLLTAPSDKRLESLHRAMHLLDAKRQGVQWTPREVRNVFNFLFGSDKAAQRAANNWAADFFRSRGKTTGDDDQKETPEPTEENVAAE